VPYGPHRAVIERVVDGDFLAGRLPEGSEYWLMTEQDMATALLKSSC
jgi:hypothetical protein